MLAFQLDFIPISTTSKPLSVACKMFPLFQRHVTMPQSIQMQKNQTIYVKKNSWSHLEAPRGGRVCGKEENGGRSEYWQTDQLTYGQLRIAGIGMAKYCWMVEDHPYSFSLRNISYSSNLHIFFGWGKNTFSLFFSLTFSWHMVFGLEYIGLAKYCPPPPHLKEINHLKCFWYWFLLRVHSDNMLYYWLPISKTDRYLG